MMKYNDNTGRSGIGSYEIEENQITVVFKGGGTYHYPLDTEFQKRLEEGDGANTYLNENLK